MPLPSPGQIEPDVLSLLLDFGWKVAEGLVGALFALAGFVMMTRSKIKEHDANFEEHQDRIDALETKVEDARVAIARLPTREDLNLVQNQISQQIRDSHNQIAQLMITRTNRD